MASAAPESKKSLNNGILKRGHNGKEEDWEDLLEEDSNGTGAHKGQHDGPKRLKRSPPKVGGSQKPQAEEGGREFTTDPAKLAMMSRSERKRHREKKRRSDVNKGFEELVSLLVEVDDGVRGEVEEERARRAQVRAEQSSKSGGGGGGEQGEAAAAAIASSSSPTNVVDDNILSRVDLIDRATTVLRRIHAENEQRKAVIDHLLLAYGRVQQAGGAGPTGADARSSLTPMYGRTSLNHPCAAPSLGRAGLSAAADDPILSSLLAAAASGAPLGSTALQREALLQQMEIRQMLAGGGGGVSGLHGGGANGGGGGPDWTHLQARARAHPLSSSSSVSPSRVAAQAAALSGLPLSQGELIRLATSGGLDLSLPPPPPPNGSRGSQSIESHLIRTLLLQQQQELGRGGNNGGGRNGSA